MAVRPALILALCGLLGCLRASAQIDPDKRQLLHLGYNAFLQGHAPLAGYAYYYFNRPVYYHSNLTMRMAVAPVYLDAELGIARALGPNTDLGIGISGGGFADNHNEVRGGKYFPEESFDGFGSGGSVSVYHRFNPGRTIPLHGVVRAGGYYTIYSESDDTSTRFELPDERPAANIRVGLRYGGKEPVLFPSVALEFSVWAESLHRGNAGAYGYQNDRDVSASAQLFYGHAYFAYTLERGDNFSIALTGGGSSDADRFSAYRLGGVLPQVSEFPLIIPGYYFQELSAEKFALLNARYALALDAKKKWQLTAMGATAAVDYVKGLDRGNHWNSGVGGGLAYRSQYWKFALNYGYGFNAVRGEEHGAHVLGMLVQFDFEHWLNNHRSVPFPGEVRPAD